MLYGTIWGFVRDDNNNIPMKFQEKHPFTSLCKDSSRPYLPFDLGLTWLLVIVCKLFYPLVDIPGE